MADSRPVSDLRRIPSPEPPEVRYVTDFYLLIRKGGEVRRTGALNLMDIQQKILGEKLEGAGPEVEFEIRSMNDGQLRSATGGRWSR